MKKIFLAIIMIASTMTAINAQTTQTAPANGSKAESPQAKAKKMVGKLNSVVMLQGDQWAKVNNLYIDFVTKKDAVKNDVSLSKDVMKSKIQALKADRDKQLKTILTPEQWTKWDAAVQKEEQNEKNEKE